MPSAQAIKSGVPLGVTGAYTTPSTGWLLWSSPTDTAEPSSPLRKSLVPSFGSTTQHQASPVKTCPVSSPHQSQGRIFRSSARRKTSISTSMSALSPKPLRPPGRTHSAASNAPARSTTAVTAGSICGRLGSPITAPSSKVYGRTLGGANLAYIVASRFFKVVSTMPSGVATKLSGGEESGLYPSVLPKSGSGRRGSFIWVEV